MPQASHCTLVRDNVGQALAIALLAPPFPFAAFVMAAAAPFTFLGLLALRFGESILKWSEHPIVQGFLFMLIISALWAVSVYAWIRRCRFTSRSPPDVTNGTALRAKLDRHQKCKAPKA